VLAPGNAALVDKGVRIVESLGGRIATVAEARSMLGLREATAVQGTVPGAIASG